MLVSKQDYCLADLLQRHRRDELHMEVPDDHFQSRYLCGLGRPV